MRKEYCFPDKNRIAYLEKSKVSLYFGGHNLSISDKLLPFLFGVDVWISFKQFATCIAHTIPCIGYGTDIEYT